MRLSQFCRAFAPLAMAGSCAIALAAGDSGARGRRGCAGLDRLSGKHERVL